MPPPTRPDEDPGLPIKLDPCSNGEFLPPPATPLVREAQRRARDDIERTARRLGMDRRHFLGTLGAAAATLLAVNACSDDQERARGGSRAGGRYDLDETTTTEPEAARDALGGDEPIMDVQGHLLEFDLDAPADRTDRGFWSGFPQAGCDEDDPRACFSMEHFLEELFLKSDTTMVVLSAIPIIGPVNPLSIEVMERTRKVLGALCDDDRILVHGQANPNVGDLSAALAGMEAMVADHDISAWKVYTHSPAGRGWSFDDRDRDAPQVGEAFLRQAADLDHRIVCVHKGLSGGDPWASPADIGPAAKAHPDLTFVVYHSGYEAGAAEGPYDPAGDTHTGVDRLLASLDAAGIPPGANVYAELGSTWRALMGNPTEAAHVLGKLLSRLGPDRVLWGTDSIWYGSPQDQIQAFRAFQISPELQERHGYPELTPAVKRQVLGANAAALYGVDLPRVPCTFSREELQAAREAAPASYRTWGPQTATQVRAHLAAHGGLL